MQILYLAFVRLPTEKAHGLQIMKVCEALARAGAKVTLQLPGRTSTLTENPFTYYGVERVFTIEITPVPDLLAVGRLGFALSVLLFGLRSLGSINDFVISQDEWALLPHVFLGRSFVYEVHMGRWNSAARLAARHARLIVANSAGTRQFYLDRGISSDKIVVMPNGVDIERFAIRDTKEEAREKLGLPRSAKLLLYTGHLFDWKGAETLADAVKLLPQDIEAVFVGGVPKDVKRFRAAYGDNPRIHIVGHRPPHEIPLFLRAADVLVLPNIRKGESEQFTSPMKLFEYLAAGQPIVASDLPSVREIASEHEAFFFEPGNAAALADAAQEALQPTAASKAAAARTLAKKYDWDRSALVARLRTL
jgi:glycosyltransferase involved in cell wall biosynthesis